MRTLGIILILFSFPLTISSCITFKSMKNKVDDPIERLKIEEQLKTEEDIEYWNRVKTNNRNATIIIDDTKRRK